MKITYNKSTIILPNITVEEVLQNGAIIGYRLTAIEGFSIYDASANDTAPKTNPETGEIVPVPIINYFKQITIPVNIPVEKWTWVAVLEEATKWQS